MSNHGIANIELKEHAHDGRGNHGALDFSIMFFASDAARQQDRKYELLMSCVDYADRNGFAAVWIPERHFHRFGGPFPNPAVLGAAIAAVSSNIRIRAGSVIIPLHEPIRVAEEWSMVDNLSGGRVDLAFGQGWNPNDFVLAPTKYDGRLTDMYKSIQEVTLLWKGGTLMRRNGVGEEVEIAVYPPPLQSDLNVWITCSGGIDRFVEAGAIGANVLTALLFQDIEELKKKIQAYRDARAQNGFDPNTGKVTLMMHTFLGAEINDVRKKVQAPMTKYLEDSIDLWRQKSMDLEKLPEDQRRNLIEFAFHRYMRTQSLLGTPETCAPLARNLVESGVNEIACLIDFGVDNASVLQSLPFVEKLKQAVAKTDGRVAR
jgi:natural product biosynthesis luciferase-like monooxygenase protein